MKKLALLGILLFGAFQIAAGAELLPVGSEARKFLNLNLQNQHVGLRDYVGPSATQKVKSVILSFWSISCIPCRNEMPLVQAWAEKHKGEVELFFINVDKKDDMDKVHAFVDENKIGGTVLLDFYQTTAKAYNVCDGNNCSVPTLYVIDSQGFIRFVSAGYEESKNLGSSLDKFALSAAPIATPAANLTTPAAKLSLLHNVLVSLNHEELAKKNGISKDQLVQLLKDAEAATKKQWGL